MNRFDKPEVSVAALINEAVADIARNKAAPRNRLVRRGPSPLALEQRFVFDGAAAADAAHHAAAPVADGGERAGATRADASAEKPAAPAAVEAPVAPAKEIVFVDSRVPDSDKLVAALGDKVEVVVLDANRDGVEQIGQALAGRTDVSAVHIMSHGSNGNITLGNATLSVDSVDRYASALQGWGKSLTGNADILLYGCDVAGGNSGGAFIGRLAALTGADVAASTDVTGSRTLGGDWVLESNTGTIEVRTLDMEKAGYHGELETTVYDTNWQALTFNNKTDIVGTGTSANNIVRFNSVITVDGQAIDAVITTNSLNNSTISNYDSTSNPSANGAFFQPNMSVTTKTSGGSMTFTIEFYKAGTYTGVGTGTAVTLQNVVVNSYDIDSTGGTATDRQYQVFKGFARYELANSTQLVASTQGDGSVKFLYTTNSPANVSDIYADANRVKVYYDSISSFVIESGVDKVGAANVQGTAYFALDFSVGPNWTGETTITGTPAPNLVYNSTQFVEAGANNGSISTVRTITLNNGTFTGTDDQALSGVSVSNVPAGLTAVVTRTSATTATLSFTGTATNHADANDINNVTVTFGNAAFTSGNAGSVTGATRGDISIDFADPSGNSPAVIGGDDAGAVTEDASTPNLTDSGTLTISDADDGEAQFLTGANDIIASEDALGSLTIAANGAWTYTVANSAVQYLKAGETKAETFTVKTTDGTTHDIVITITGTNDAASIGGADTGAVTEDASTPNLTDSGTLTVSDTDNGEAQFLTGANDIIASEDALGSLAIAANGAWTYTVANSAVQYLAAGETKTETFTVKTTDGSTHDIVITITGTNDAASIGGDDTGVVTEDTSTPDLTDSGTLTISDADGGEAHFFTGANDIIASEDALGSLTIAANGAWTYTVANSAVQYLKEGETKTETFTVKSTDGSTHDIVITITGTNDAASIGGDNTGAVTEDAATPSLTDSGMLTISDTDDGEAQFLTDANDIVASAGALGSLSIDADGAWTYTVANSAVQYLKAGEIKTETFTVKSTDGTTHDIVVTITGVNDAPTAAATSINAVFGTPVSGTLPAGSDIDNDTLTYSKTSDPAHGVVTIDASGHYTYTPAQGYSGADSFTYTISDGQGGSATYTVSVTVGTNVPANFSGSDRATVVEDSGDYVKSGTLTVVDPDGANALVARNNVAGNYGTFSIDTAGHWTYTANNTLLQPLNGAAAATETFTVSAADGTTHQIVITLDGVNDAPTAAAGSISTAFGKPATGSLPAATDVDLDAVTYAKASDPAHGSVTIAADGSYSYTPAPGFSGTDTFTYTVSDGRGGSATYTVSIAVAANVPANFGGSDRATVTKDSNDYTRGGKLDVSDTDGANTLVPQSGVAGRYGTFSIDASGNWTYVASNAQLQPLRTMGEATDVFTVTAADGTTHAVTITLNGREIPPPLPTPVAPVAPMPAPQAPVIVAPTPAASAPAVVFDSGLPTATLSGNPIPNNPLAPVFEPATERGSAAEHVYTSNTGFPIVVIEAPQPTLTIYRGVTDQYADSGARSSFSLPYDAFAHTNPNERIMLAAKLADGRPLPSWVQFDAQNGKFEYAPPANFRGEMVIKVIARDTQGREVTVLFRFSVGDKVAGEKAAGGRSALSDQLRMAGKRGGFAFAAPVDKGGAIDKVVAVASRTVAKAG